MNKFVSIFLSLIILISSTGITFSTHYCMGRAVDSKIVVGVHELGCGMMDLDVACDTNAEGTYLMAPTCCDNVYLSIEIEDDYQKVSESISLGTNFLFAFTYTFLFDYKNNNEPPLAHADDLPPPLAQDYQSLYQSYLL